MKYDKFYERVNALSKKFINHFSAAVLVGTFFVVCFFSFANVARADITTGLISWWKFDDGSGTTATNSASSTNGTLVNFPGDNSGWTSSGHTGGSLIFDGATSSRYVSLPSPITLPTGKGFSLGFWAKTSLGQGDFVEGSSGQGGIKMYATINTLSAWSGNSGVLSTGVPSPITDATQWHHILMTKSSGGLWKAYIDGVSVVNTIALQPNDLAFTVLNFGRRAGNYLNGQLDDIRLYDRELSSSDASELYSYVYTAPILTTEAASSVTSVGATLNGTISDEGGKTPTVRGFTYGLTTAYTATITENGSFSTGAYTGSVISLTCNTLYHYRSYATSIIGTGYGGDTTFTTSACATSAPTVSVLAASNISTSTITLNGSIDATGGADATTRGFEYGLSAFYGITTSTNGSYGTGSFSRNVTGLLCSALYHYRSFAINSAGTAFSTDQTFFTSACPAAVSISAASSITSFTAMLNANITDIGGANVTTRGFQYGTTTAYGQSVSTAGTYAAGSYSQTAVNMQCNTLYHWRAYATNSGSTVTSADATLTTSACPTNFYVSPTGVSTNNGSIDYPWDLQTALSGGLGGIAPGSTVWLRNGTYTSGAQLSWGNILTQKLFVSTVNGQEGLPVTFRQYPGERATVDGGIESRGDWTTFWGFEIMNSNTNRNGCTTDRAGGINFYARGGKAINMVIHDVGHPGIGFWNPVGDGGELYGNILWANGLYDTCTPPGTPSAPGVRGSGFYMQNTTGTRYIHDNISFWEFTTGMKAYGQNTSGFEFKGNVVFNNAYENLFVTANGSTTKRLKLISNFTFQKGDSASGNIGLGIYFPGIYDPGEDVVIQNNYFATGDIIPWGINGNYPAGAFQIKDFSDMTVTGNTFVGGIVADLLVTNRVTNMVWNNNTYYSTRIAFPNYPFLYQSIPSVLTTTFFSGWKTNCNCDSSSLYTTGLPTSNAIFVRPNTYEFGRANIIVYNWQSKAAETVDVSSVLNPGDIYEVRDAQNYYGTPVAQGTYPLSGGNISIPLGSTAESVPVGTIVVDPTHTPVQFDVFVLIRRSTAAGATPAVSGAAPVSGIVTSVTVAPPTTTTSTLPLPPVVLVDESGKPLMLPAKSIASPVAVFVHTLGIGSKGEEVKQLQQKLKDLGYFKHPKITGFFGPATKAAVVAFQKAQGIEAAPGKVGPSTRAVLNAMNVSAESAPSATPVSSMASPVAVFVHTLNVGSKGNDILQLQKLLNTDPATRVSNSGAGSPGRETNYFGLRTQRALQKFQTKYKIISFGSPKTTGYGRLGPKTLAKFTEVFGADFQKVVDTDGDGLSDDDETLIWHSDPLNPDTDGDGYPDGHEVENGYSPIWNQPIKI